MTNTWRLFDSQFGRQARAAEATWARSLSPSDRMAIVEDLYLTARQVHERAADWHTVESVAWKRTLGERQRFVAALLGYGQIRVSSKIARLVVADVFVEFSSPPDSVRRGERKKMVWQLTHKTPFEGSAPVRLVGMPKGVEVHEPLPTVTRDTKEIAFDIEATDDALIGFTKDIACEITVTQGGQPVKQKSGQGELRVDPRP